MTKYLPIAWLLLIPLSLALMTVIGVSTLAEYDLARYTQLLSGALQAVFLYGAYAAIYAIFSRVVSNPIVFRLGWIHLVSASIALCATSYVRFISNQALAAREAIDREQLIVFAVLGSLASLIGFMSFFGAAVAAFYSARKRIQLQTFD